MEIDFVRVLGEVQRDIHSKMIEGQEARVIVLSRQYQTTPEDLWNALTDSGRLRRWFLPISGELKEGGHYQFEGNAGGKILNCEAPTHFHVTWEFGGQVSWVEVTLTPHGETTNLQLEHAALVSDGKWDQFGPGAVGVGWDMAVLGLTTHLETGNDNDTAVFMAWAVSENGKAFCMESSRLWGEASISFGTPESEARAASARTTAFYTGASS